MKPTAYIVFVAILLIMTIISGWISPHKFIRVKNDSCQSSWIDLSKTTLTPVCCDASKSERPCYYGMSSLKPLSGTLMGAWGIPLLAVIVNLVHATVHGKSDLQRSAALRFVLYVSIMIYRTFALYLGLNYVEELFVTTPTDCPYKSMRANNACLRDFDHADHLVLFLTHFVLISCLEIHAMQNESLQRSRLHQQAVKMWYALLLSVTTYCIFHTGYSFHRVEENIAAWIIFFACVVLPLRLVVSRGVLRRCDLIRKDNNKI